MRPTLCVELLNTFSDKELDDFTKFVSSDYFNSDKLVIGLLNALKKWVLNITFFDSQIQCRVYQSVFGNLPDTNTTLLKKHKNKLNLKLNALLRLAEKFLSIEQLQNDQWSKLDYLYIELLKRKQYHLYKRHSNKDAKAIKEEKIKDIAHYENLYKIYWINIEYLSATRKLLDEEHINELIEYNDLSYLLKKLNIQLTLLSLEYYPQKNYNLSSYTAITNLISLPQYKLNSQIVVSLASIDLMKNNSFIAFKNFLSVINKNEDNLSKIDLRGFYQLAINFCVYQIRKGDFEFYSKAVSIYKKMHEKSLLIVNETISVILIVNIVTSSCRVGEYGWAMEISNGYLKYIDKSIRKSAHRYIMGIISFFKKEFDDAHNYFAKMHITNTSLDLNARIYVIKCLYENSSDFSQYFVQSIRSLQEYLKNQKKTPHATKQGYLNFAKLLLQLYQVKFNKGKLGLDDLEFTLNQHKFYSDKVWLLEKIQDFKNPN